MPEEQKEIIISYETLYDLLRREKNRSEIQRLPDNFLSDLSGYVKGIRQEIKKKRREVEAYSAEELRKDEHKLESLIRLVTEFYEKRERKIISMALTRSRTKADLADVANLLPEEKRFFSSLAENLDHNREVILAGMLGSDHAKEAEKPSSPVIQPAPPEPAKPQKEGKVMIRFLGPVPRFFDRQMNVLGPFEKDDKASLPLDIADILIKKGKAESAE